MVDIHFLGSGGSIPTEERRHPAYLIRHEGWNILWDAGEAVQMRIEPFGINRKMIVCLSHRHPDHVIGLAGILLRFSLMGRIKPMAVYGPKELIPWIKVQQESINLGTTFETTVYGIEEGIIWEDDFAKIRSFEVDHRGYALGYEFTYSRPTGKFLPEKAKELGIPQGALWGKLAAGESIQLEDGTTVNPSDVSLPPDKGIKIVYSGDTRPCDNVREAAKGADILIHEGMYSEEHSDMADERGHSTAKQAAQIAKDAGVGLLVLTHYSPRYENGDVILKEAKSIFENTIVAKDMMKVSLSNEGEVRIEPSDS
ncbi:MAG: ribonuclease Z [Candidatus Thorarchaeota archaeon]|jgi:ribonuclease Z